VSCQIHFGEPLWFEGTGAEPEPVIAEYVETVRASIAALIAKGLEIRPRAFMTTRIEP
jgi:hypothetical protein